MRLSGTDRPKYELSWNGAEHHPQDPIHHHGRPTRLLSDFPDLDFSNSFELVSQMAVMVVVKVVVGPGWALARLPLAISLASTARKIKIKSLKRSPINVALQ